jgi:hypothetical protein
MIDLRRPSPRRVIALLSRRPMPRWRALAGADTQGYKASSEDEHCTGRQCAPAGLFQNVGIGSPPSGAFSSFNSNSFGK